MSRSIKFKGVHPSTGVVMDVCVIDWMHDEVYFEQGSDVAYSIDECKLMQLTGIKDKNGVEIYEGDIVDLGQTVNGCNIFVIEWNGFGFIPRYGVEMVTPRVYEYDVSEFYSICPHTEDGLKVIGNIHQNPELLK